jgi:hypothetical protein
MAQGRSDSASSKSDNSPRKLDLSEEKHSDIPDGLDYVPITPSDLAEKAEEIKRKLQDTHRHKSEVVKMIMSNQSPKISTELGNRLGNLRISFLLVTVINHIADNQIRQARKQAKQSLSLAQASNDKLSIARCRYWIGRIEFEKQNMEAAHDHFLAARPYLMDNINPEGETVQFYLDASRRGISEQYLKRILLQHNEALVENAPHERPFRRPNQLSRKRKWEVQPWKVALRPAPVNKGGRRQNQYPEVTITKSSKSLKERIVSDMPDIPFGPKYSPGTSKPYQNLSGADRLHGISDATGQSTDFISTGGMGAHNSHTLEGMERLQAAYSRPRLEQRGKFTLRCYPVGLAPRTRPPDIFSRLPGEVLLPAQEWESLRNQMSNRAITMAYLARERQLILSRKEEISRIIGTQDD